MLDQPDVDVIVGGGGVAGIAAAALQQLGYRIMVVEPGQHDERRLAGEVFHPPGVSGLADLGLLPTLREKPAVNVSGFSVMTCENDYIRLPYDSVPAHLGPGLCLEHALIRERMLSALSALPNVTVKRGARVVGIDQSHQSHVAVDVANGSDSGSHRCRIFVVADGSPSRLARMAGIAVHNRRISTVWGYRIGTKNLPQRDFGHVFLGAATPILLYPIGGDTARILFDIPYQSYQPTAAHCLALAQSLPLALREEVTHTIRTQQRMSVVTRATTTDRIAHGRVVLVGDAGGSCHPLTATGMTMCVSDALLLRKALAERPGDLPAALQLYQRRRHWPQATRLVLADALRDALCGTSPELRVVQGGILALWRDSAVARSATVALLSTADGRPSALIRQIVAASLRGFVAHLRNPKLENRGIGAISVARLLIATLFRNARQVLTGTIAVARKEATPAPEHAPPAHCD